VRTNPDAILGFNGIGPKVYEEILECVNTYEFPKKKIEEVVEVAQPAEEVSAVEVVVPEVVTTPASEIAEESDDEETEEVPEPILKDVQPAQVVGEGTDDKSFEELFRLDTMRRDKVTTEDDDELNQLGDSKKKKGKKRRGYTVEFDPDQNTDVVRYTHRKDEDEWENW